MFLTDGMLERNTKDVDIAAVIAAVGNERPREAVQHLMQVILEATAGTLKDDATAMCFDWHGGPPRHRS